MNSQSARQRLRAFREWFSDNGGFIHDDAELSYDESKGIQLKASKSIAPGTLVVSCPHSLTISSLNANGISLGVRDARFAPEDSSLKCLRLPIGSARNQCQAAMFLGLQFVNAGQSHWKPYLDILPKPPSGQNLSERHVVDTPIWWSPQDRSCLERTSVEAGLSGLEALWHSDWDSCHDAMDDWLRRDKLDVEHGGSSSRQSSLSHEVFQWALTMFGSRAFGSSQLRHVREGSKPVLSVHDPDSLLYPGVDMLNHSVTTTNTWHCDDTRFGIVCNDRPRPGDEIVNTYGAKTNAQLLLSWGFVIADNPHDAYALKLSPSIQPQSFEHPPILPEDQLPDRRPPAADPQHNIYYVRDVSRHRAEECGYYAADNITLQPHLAGFPAALLEALSMAMLNDRERQLDSRRQQHEADRPCQFPSCLGHRCMFALTVLLLNRLNVEAANLLSSQLRPDLRKSGQAEYSHTPRDKAELLVLGQSRILENNIKVLEDYVTASLADRRPGASTELADRHAEFRSSGSNIAPGKVFTLTKANALLADLHPSTHRWLIEGLASHLESSDIATLEDAGWSMDIWAVWFCIVLDLLRDDAPQPAPSERCYENRSDIDSLAAAVHAWRSQVVPDAAVDPDALTSVNDLINGLRYGGADADDGSRISISPRLEDAFQAHAIRRAVYLVSEEMISIHVGSERTLHALCVP